MKLFFRILLFPCSLVANVKWPGTSQRSRGRKPLLEDNLLFTTLPDSKTPTSQFVLSLTNIPKTPDLVF